MGKVLKSFLHLESFDLSHGKIVEELLNVKFGKLNKNFLVYRHVFFSALFTATNNKLSTELLRIFPHGT